MRNDGHNRSHLRKYEKHCILKEVVSSSQISQICTCRDDGAPQNEQENTNESTFAVDGERTHLRNCPVLQLKQRYEQAKLDELLHHQNMVKRKNWVGKLLLIYVAPRIQFGNVHMALRVGTLIIENGVAE
jgi:hypothetical protein